MRIAGIVIMYIGGLCAVCGPIAGFMTSGWGGLGLLVMLPIVGLIVFVAGYLTYSFARRSSLTSAQTSPSSPRAEPQLVAVSGAEHSYEAFLRSLEQAGWDCVTEYVEYCKGPWVIVFDTSRWMTIAFASDSGTWDIERPTDAADFQTTIEGRCAELSEKRS